MQEQYKELLKRFDRLTQKQYAGLSLWGIQVALISSITLLVLLSSLESLGNFSTTVRTIFFFFYILVSGGILGFFFIKPGIKYLNLFSKTNYFDAARMVGKYFPSLKDDLLNAMQLITVDKDKKYYSGNLADAAFQQIYKKTEPVDFSKAINYSRAKGLLRYTLLAAAAAIILFTLSGNLRAASGRIFDYGTEYIPPARFSFVITPGNAHLTKGQSITIRVRITGAKPAVVTIGIKSIEQTEYDFKQLSADSTGIYMFQVPNVRSSFDYVILAEDISSGVFRIEVVDRPIIKTLNVTVTPPSYSRLPQVDQKDNGNVSALLGSKINFKLSSTSPLKKAELFFNDSTTFPLNVQGNEAGGTYSIKKNIDYRIIVTDVKGNTNESPITYSIKTQTDAPPAIEMVLPNRNTTLSEDNRTAFLLKISDDFGFNRLVLHYSKYSNSNTGHGYSEVQIPINKSLKEEDVNYIWNLSNLNLKENDEVSYYFEVFDNDYVSGPKSSRTSSFTIRVPSLNELLNQADNTQNHAEQKLTNVLKESADLKDELKHLEQDLKKDKQDVSWQEKERVEKALDKFNQLESKIEEVRKELSEMQNDLRENNLLSRETMEKYLELQDIFRELSSEEMQKAMEKMQQALQQLNRNKIEQSLGEMKFSEEQFKNSVERTLKLLKRIQVEQKMDEVVKRSELLEKKLAEQKDAINRSNLNRQDEKHDLTERQENITEEMKHMAESMEELSHKMNEFRDMPKSDMEKMASEFEQQQNDELSQEAEDRIQQGQRQQSANNNSQMQKNMQQMKSSMTSMQKQMQQKNQRQSFNDMRRILNDLLSLSKDQESLKNKTQNLEQNSSAYTENAKRQMNLMNNMDKLFSQFSQLSQKSFAISPEMAKAMGEAQNSMRHSTQALQNRNGLLAGQQQTKAMKGLNEAASMMKSTMENMMGGGSGGGSGMMSLMQQLEQLTKQQMNINNMTQAMQQGSLSQQQMAQMQRIAQQQDLIRKSMEQLNRESRKLGESKKIPANLEQIAKEMQEAVSEMKAQHLGDNLTQKQEKILSRMLDAQRSINDRDYEQQRESQSGIAIARRSPAELNFRTPKGKERLKEELSRAVQEGFAKDYEDLIRKYYEAITK